ncbi:hypothetical protein O6V14_04515 [Sphingomonas faeni]|uniref:hypothetical protein n=1 Tax=Sphingomonas faeni TaxID=185950 RepID=UPI00334B5B54
MSDLITFNIYGGPDAGKITQVAPGVTTHSVGGFDYTLAQTGADRWSFLPSRDADLVAAYQRTDGEPGNAEAAALVAEIERRGLDI